MKIKEDSYMYEMIRTELTDAYNGSAEGVVVNIGIPRNKDEVNLLPAPLFHFISVNR